MHLPGLNARLLGEQQRPGKLSFLNGWLPHRRSRHDFQWSPLQFHGQQANKWYLGYRSCRVAQPHDRIVLMKMFVAVILIASMFFGCSFDSGNSKVDSQSELFPHTGVPANGMCQTGLVLTAGEDCMHEFSFRSGTSISDSGAEPIVETISNRFYVDSDGIGYYGDSEGATAITRNLSIGDVTFTFAAYSQSDGTFYIEEATQSTVDPVSSTQPTSANCKIGMELAAGDRCTLEGGLEFYAMPDGSGCIGESICAGTGLNISGISAEKNASGTWSIVALP